MVTNKNLFLICPDCTIERTIENKFGRNTCFLTALGSVFNFSDFNHASALNRFLHDEAIAEIIVVNDTHCTFINNVICKNNNYNTIAEKELPKIQTNNSEKLAQLNVDQQKEFLAELNIYRQAYELLDVAFVGSKISDETIKISGLIYNRNSSKFKRITLDL
ncbi:carbonic anhydrase [Hymenobacter sp. YC55]|uniref:carbonic anhydrase n=1 Tax=Hymenobacter sp. YC55 TaxID=3034019 RepID=UPI0023FA3992|nr:carbonic anhydrase [Hymenobacter sp. YC55]MDF7815421.1 carbonic anhydrase [Hymenobacter sp. YC55]